MRPAKSAVAAGADGLIIEVHPHPEEAWSDGPQSLTFKEFEALMSGVTKYLPLEVMRRLFGRGA